MAYPASEKSLAIVYSHGARPDAPSPGNGTRIVPDRTGNRPQNVPERLADFVLTYSPKALPVSLAASVRHNGNFFTENANVVKVNAFTTFDASIAWRTPVGTLTVRGRNLTDRFYADWSGYASGLVFIGAPRSFDISFTRRF